MINLHSDELRSPEPQESTTSNPAEAKIANRLSDKHYKQCIEERGLNPEWVLANCRSMEIKDASTRLGYPAKSAGVWLEGVNGFGQFRPNKPWRNEGDKKAPKYRTATKEEYDAMLPHHPSDPLYGKNLEALKALCYSIDGHPCLLLAEGLFKAIAGCSNGFPTVAIAGVEQGLTSSKNDVQGKRYLVATLERLARAGFGFIITFDADENPETVKNVASAQRKLAQQLVRFKIPVYIATGFWRSEQGKGMDDFIKNQGADAFRNVLNKAVNFAAWEQQFAQENPRGEDVTESGFTKKFAEKCRAKLAWNVPAKAWYWYESKNHAGVWGEIPSEEAMDVVITELEALGVDFSSRFVNGVLTMLKAKLRVNEWQVIKKLICLEDCVVNIDTLEVSQHQPGYRFLSRLPYRWNDREIGCEPIKEWLLEICGDRPEWVEVLRGAINATITERGGELQRFVELIGAGSTGKGTLLRVVQQMLGKENYAVTTLKEMEQNRFESAKFYGKKAIFITDSERYASEVSRLKAITGDDEVPIEKKGVQQTGGFKFSGIVWVAANEAMQSSDYTNGLARRRLSLSFDKVIPPNKRRDLIEEFKPYFPGLLFWALSMDGGEVADYVSNTSKRVASLAKFSAEILLETNPLANWADQNLYYDPSIETKIGDATGDVNHFLYANYSQWSSANGQGTMTTQRFSTNLLNLLKTQLGIDAVKRKTNKGRFITCIGIRQPGHNFPLLISDDPSDDPVTTQVTTQSLASDDTQQSDDLLIDFNSNQPSTNTAYSFPIEGTDQGLDGRHLGSISSPASVLGRHQVVTRSSLGRHQVVTNQPETVTLTNPQIVESVGSDDTQPILNLSQQITAAWNRQWKLGNLILAIADTDELRAEVKGYTPEQIKHIKAAANFCWQPQRNEFADYSGDRVEVWEASNENREVDIRTFSGNMQKVKRGNLSPWLGI